MNDKTLLQNVRLAPDSIWGDKNETVVYAQVFTLHIRRGSMPIFRFYRNPRHSPKSLANRVVNYYHKMNVHDDALSFINGATMQTAIWSSIASVWPRCETDRNILKPGTMIDISSDDSDGLLWCVYQSPLFDEYLGLFRHIKRSDLVPSTSFSPTIDISKIRLRRYLGSRGCAQRVDAHRPAGKPITCFFKGIDFATYLRLRDDDNESIRSVVETWRRSSKLVADMSPRPYIQPPPLMIVSVHDSKGNEVLIGHLSQFFYPGDLASVIGRANLAKTPTSLKEKSMWCFEMSRVVTHTHHILHTFHMNINPRNLVMRPGGSLILVDWAQSGATATTLAPEADGTWDVKEETTDEGTRLVYTKYTGSPRRNMPKGSGPATFDAWNVFPGWHAAFPKATELAEVFALGRTMWMVLTQTVSGFDEVKHPDDVRVTWDDEHNIPNNWIEMVERCMAKDPNERPGVEDLVKFWKKEWVARGF